MIRWIRTLMLLAVALAVVKWSASGAVGPGGAGLDASAQAFINRVGVTNSKAKARIDGYVRDLKNFGIWTNHLDTIIGSSLLNPSSGSNILTLKGWATVRTTNHVNQSLLGLNVESGIQFLSFNVPDTRTYSILVKFRSVIGYQTDGAVVTALDAATGSNYAHHLGVAYSPIAYNGIETISNNISARTAVQFNAVAGTQGASATDSYEHAVLWTSDNAGRLNTYVDGYPSQTSGATNQIMLSPLTVLTLGNYMSGTDVYPSTLWRGVINSVTIWSTPLSSVQASNATMVSRWLNHSSENLIIEGDSTSQHSVGSPTISWPYHYYLQPAVSNNLVVYSVAAGGDPAANMRLTYTNQIRPLAPGAFGVDEATLVFAPGINDLLAGTAAATIFSHVSEVVRNAAGDGFKVWLATVPPSMSYSAAQQTQRTLLNDLILTNQMTVERVLRRDVLYSITNTASGVDFAADGLHFTSDGYRKMAGLVGASGRFREPGPASEFSASLNFPSTSSGAVSSLVITANGTYPGDRVALFVPNVSSTVIGSYYGVASNDTVHVIFVPTAAAQDPAVGTFTAVVTR